MSSKTKLEREQDVKVDAFIGIVKKVIHFFIGERSIGQFIRYLVTGFSSFGLEYGIFFVMYYFMDIYEVIANSTSIFIAFWFNFLLNRFWSFKSKGDLGKQVVQYLMLFAFNMTFSNLFIYAFSEYTPISPLITKVMVMCFIVMWNFILYKKVIFKDA